MVRSVFPGVGQVGQLRRDVKRALRDRSHRYGLEGRLASSEFWETEYPRVFSQALSTRLNRGLPVTVEALEGDVSAAVVDAARIENERVLRTQQAREQLLRKRSDISRARDLQHIDRLAACWADERIRIVNELRAYFGNDSHVFHATSQDSLPTILRHGLRGRKFLKSKRIGAPTRLVGGARATALETHVVVGPRPLAWLKERPSTVVLQIEPAITCMPQAFWIDANTARRGSDFLESDLSQDVPTLVSWLRSYGGWPEIWVPEVPREFLCAAWASNVEQGRRAVSAVVMSRASVSVIVDDVGVIYAPSMGLPVP
jgi:hypothetical protein